jgi:AbrB family looped-hinge helix DNA binding protein
MEHREEQGSMALVRVKRAGQVTLPAELRKQFHLEEGDYLEAEAVENGILFRPVSVVDRQQARQHLGVLLDRVHAQMPPSEQPPHEHEEEITRIIKELRQDDAAVRRS